MSDLSLIVGLGNPGPRYAATRHNVGFMAIDDLAGHLGGGPGQNKWNVDYVRAWHQGRDLLLVKPLTYMNRSGEAVVRFRDYFRIDNSKVVVVHDDLDLPAGRIKIVNRGGAGGHNGIRSLISHLGDDFVRVKIGIGRPLAGEDRPAPPVDQYVLADFSTDERKRLDEILPVVRRALLLIIEQGSASAMNEINGLR